MKTTAIAVSLALAIGLAAPACAYTNHQTQTCTVNGKDRTQNSESVSEMRVYTDCGTFVVEDNFISGFNSADLFGRLQPGTLYEIKSGGYRVGVMSMFPTILEVKEL